MRSVTDEQITDAYAYMMRVARRFASRAPTSVTADDLVSIGAESLMRQANGFKPEAGREPLRNFWVYAKRGIVGEMREHIGIAIREQNESAGSFQEADKIEALELQATARRGRPVGAKAEPRKTLSMALFGTEDGDLTVARNLLKRLPKRKRMIMALYYDSGLTDLDIARRFETSPDSIRSIRQRTLCAVRCKVMPAEEARTFCKVKHNCGSEVSVYTSKRNLEMHVTLRSTPFVPIFMFVCPKLEMKFWSRVEVKGDDECWPWLAGRGGRKGRAGRYSFVGRNFVAARVSFVLQHNREVAEGCEVSHVCFNALCVNPVHLKESPHQPIMENAALHGIVGGVPPKSKRKGAQVPNAILNDESVARARLLRAKEKLAYEDICIKLGYAGHRATMRDAVIGKSWRHVPTPAVEVERRFL